MHDMRNNRSKFRICCFFSTTISATTKLYTLSLHDALPILTCEFAKLEPPPPEMKQLFGALQGNQSAMDDFVSVMAGTLPVPEFFGPENIGRIMAQAAAVAG